MGKGKNKRSPAKNRQKRLICGKREFDVAVKILLCYTRKVLGCFLCLPIK